MNKLTADLDKLQSNILTDTAQQVSALLTGMTQIKSDLIAAATGADDDLQALQILEKTVF